MTTSDNVIRAGLTEKYIDIKTLIKCVKKGATHQPSLISYSIGINLHHLPTSNIYFGIITLERNIQVISLIINSLITL